MKASTKLYNSVLSDPPPNVICQLDHKKVKTRVAKQLDLAIKEDKELEKLAPSIRIGGLLEWRYPRYTFEADFEEIKKSTPMLTWDIEAVDAIERTP